MSTKNSLIFAFMIIFLATMLVTLGMWFHYALELDIKNKALNSVEKQHREKVLVREKLEKALNDPDYGLVEQLKLERNKADLRYAMVHTDQAARKTLFEEKEPEIKAAWESGKKKWDAVYAEWKERNAKLKTLEEGLKVVQKETRESAHQRQEDMLRAFENEEKLRRDYVQKRKDLENEIDTIRVEAEEVQERINKVARDLEKEPDEKPDGHIVFAAVDLNKVTVDLGFQHGAKAGLKFKVYSARHNIPVLKGNIMLNDVRAVTSDAIILPANDDVKWDPVTGWEAPDPRMRYSIFHADKDTDAVELEKKKTLRELVNDLRIQRIAQEQGSEAAEEAARQSEAQTEPPLVAEQGHELIADGDWISNTEFVRIVPAREFNEHVVDELKKLNDVNVGILTFYFADTVQPYRKEYLKRLCVGNRCKVSPVMSPDVDHIITTSTSMRADLVEKLLKRFEGQDEVPPDVASKRTTLDALKKGLQYGSNVISEDQLESFFVKRKRKSELTKGKALQPGQHIFHVVGNTRLRSIRETQLVIEELGGHLSDALDAQVDYVVVGAGLHDAYVDLASGRVYPKDQAPKDALPFYKTVEKMGWKVLREDELLGFFGRE